MQTTISRKPFTIQNLYGLLKSSIILVYIVINGKGSSNSRSLHGYGLLVSFLFDQSIPYKLSGKAFSNDSVCLCVCLTMYFSWLGSERPVVQIPGTCSLFSFLFLPNLYLERYSSVTWLSNPLAILSCQNCWAKSGPSTEV